MFIQACFARAPQTPLRLLSLGLLLPLWLACNNDTPAAGPVITGTSGDTLSQNDGLGDLNTADGPLGDLPVGSSDSLIPTTDQVDSDLPAGNTAPTLAFTAPKDGTLVLIGQNVAFSLSVADAQDLTGGLTVTVTTSAVAAPLYQASAKNGDLLTFSTSNLPAGALTLVAKVTDSGGLSAQAQLQLLVDTAPGAPVVAIDPQQATTLTPLHAVIVQDAVDPDRKPGDLKYAFAWFKDAAATAYTGDTVPAGVAHRGETWQVQVIAADPLTVGPAGSAQIVIADAAPSSPVVAIAPDAVTLLSEVTCTLAVAATDADGDSLQYWYAWQVNGVTDASATAAHVAVTALHRGDGTALHQGDTLSCVVLATDGTLTSLPAQATAVTVQGVDVCANATLNPCAAEAQCTGSDSLAVSCVCKAGWLGDGKICIDIDECLVGSAVCDLQADCSNTAGSYVCVCHKGYQGDGKTCSDIDECAAGTAICDLHADCTNTVGAYACACQGGWAGDGKTCMDVDECASGTATCSANATCANTPGAYQCACKPGFAGDGKSCTDVDECAAGTAICDLQADCTNTVGAYACTCKTGWQGDGKTCTDLDECKAGTAKCDTNATCQNSVGSYTCTCLGGFVGDGKSCLDVDECATGLAVCDVNALCQNTPGSYGCACKTGWQGDGKSCADVDECSVGLINQPIAIGLGLPGWTVTGSSKSVGWQALNGKLYYGNSATLTYDTPGVANSGTAEVSVKVPNVPSIALALSAVLDIEVSTLTDQFVIQVDDGVAATTVFDKASLVPFAKNANLSMPLGKWAGKTVIVRFAFNTVTAANNLTSGIALSGLYLYATACDINAACANTQGSFTCTCNSGYQGDGKTCSDFNECAVNNGGCDANAQCTNSVGSFSCACKPYFQGDGKTCSDINECLANNGGCGAPTAYSCVNNVGAAPTCVDVNECSAGTAICDAAANCVNTPGSYQCVCKAGYSGDGKSCTDINECASAMLPVDFSAGLNGWTTTSSSATVKWQALAGQLYYGNAGAKNYDTPGLSNTGKLTSPAVVLAASGNSFAFALKLDVEAKAGYDVFSVSILSGGVTTLVADKTKMPASVSFANYNLSLDAWAGKSVQIVLAFDTVDATGNLTSGVTVDKLQLTGPVPVCDVNATCKNTPGSYGCTCNLGYSGDGKTCVFNPTCLVNNGGCDKNATCSPAVGGGANCACNVGWVGDGKTCSVNTACLVNNGGCDKNATCAPAAGGGATCSCAAGYTGSGQVCTDIDECATGAAQCDANATCQNTVGSYTCTCKATLSGDGKTCKPKILVLAGAMQVAGAVNDVVTKLNSTGSFGSISTYDAGTATPSLLTLQANWAVLVFTDASFADPVALGNVLADYFDGGGRVVTAVFANGNSQTGLAGNPPYPNGNIAGKFGTPANGYILITPGKQADDAEPANYVAAEVGSPLLVGVTNFAAGTGYKSIGALVNGAIVVAKWGTTGKPLLVRGVVKGRNRVDLNMYPPSATVYAGAWTGDGANLMRNALLFSQ